MLVHSHWHGCQLSIDNLCTQGLLRKFCLKTICSGFGYFTQLFCATIQNKFPRCWQNHKVSCVRRNLSTTCCRYDACVLQYSIYFVWTLRHEPFQVRICLPLRVIQMPQFVCSSSYHLHGIACGFPMPILAERHQLRTWQILNLFKGTR